MSTELSQNDEGSYVVTIRMEVTPALLAATLVHDTHYGTADEEKTPYETVIVDNDNELRRNGLQTCRSTLRRRSTTGWKTS